MAKKENNVLIIGAGDVGGALSVVLKKNYKIFIIDKKTKDKYLGKSFTVAHICFPFDKYFVDSCVEYIKVYKPEITIINSTVAVGTTEKIIKETGESPVVHSPIMGDHNQLCKSIKAFTKTIGASNKRWGKTALEHFRRAGLKTKLFDNPKTTELGKLLLTTQFALNIAFHQEMERLCKKFDVDFNESIVEMKKIFNNGYVIFRPNVIMPNLFPGKIKGSCLMQNIAILEKQYRSDFFETIKRSNGKKK